MQVFKINRMKAEAPMMAVFGIFGLMVSLAFYPLILWYSFTIFPMLAVSYWLLSSNRVGLFSKQCFLVLDDDGIRYCFHLFQKPKFLRWEQVEKVNHQLYEINFKIKDTGEVISMQKSYLDDPKDAEMLETMINQKCIIT